MNVDYRSLSEDLESGAFRRQLREELREGFEQMNSEGDPLPPPSYYATKIAEVIDAGAPVPLAKDFAYDLYQEVLLACEEALAEVKGT